MKTGIAPILALCLFRAAGNLADGANESSRSNERSRRSRKPFPELLQNNIDDSFSIGIIRGLVGNLRCQGRNDAMFVIHANASFDASNTSTDRWCELRHLGSMCVRTMSKIQRLGSNFEVTAVKLGCMDALEPRPKYSRIYEMFTKRMAWSRLLAQLLKQMLSEGPEFPCCS